MRRPQNLKKISHLEVLKLLSKVKTRWMIVFQIFVAFSEYLNFKYATNVLESFIKIGDMQSKLKKKSDDQFLDDMKKQFGDGIAIMRSDCILELIADTTGNMGSQVLKVGIMARIGYPRVIPGPERNFVYGLGWVCV